MNLFTEWLNRNNPVGLEASKKKVIEGWDDDGAVSSLANNIATQRVRKPITNVAKQAAARGVTHQSRGVYSDDSGNNKFKNQNDTLVPVAGEPQTPPENPGSPPRGYQAGHPQFRDYDQKLKTFAAWKQSQPKTEPKPEVAQAPPPEPKKKSKVPLSPKKDKPVETSSQDHLDDTGGKLDDILGDIQNKSGAGKSVVNRIRETLGNIKKPNAKVKQVLERLGDERGGFLENVINEYSQLYSPENIKKFNDSNTFSDSNSALEFMKSQLGMVEDSKGRLGYGPMNPSRAAALGQSPVSGMKFREYFGKQFHDGMGDGDFSHMDGVLGGTSGNINYDGRRKFHQKTLKNNISTQMSREVFSKLHPSIQKELTGLGQPDPSSTGVFSPDGDWEMNFHNDNGTMSGDTDFDLKQLSDDPEEREEWQKSITRGNPNENRGIMMLQKVLGSGFTDEVTGMPFMGGFKNLTADHIDGRKKAAGKTPTQDEPNNLAIIGKNINQMKSGNSSQHGDDSFNKLMNGGFKEGGMFDKLFGDDEEGTEMKDSNKFASWAAERLLGSHFDERILKVIKNKADNDGDGKVSKEERKEFITDVKDLMDMDHETLGEYMRDGGIGGIGLDLANLTKAVPRKSNAGDQNISKNTWRGGPGNSYNGTKFLDGFRKSMLSKMLTDTDLRTKIESTQSEMERKGKKPEAISESIRKIRKNWAKVNLKTPMQGHSSLYGLGRMNNEEFVNWFKENGKQNLEGIKESNPEIYEGLTKQLGELDNWNSTLKKYVGGDAPFEFPQNDPRVLSAIHDEWGKQLMRSQSSRNKLSPEEIESFYKNVTGKEDFSNPISENQLKLTPDTNLL